MKWRKLSKEQISFLLFIFPLAILIYIFYFDFLVSGSYPNRLFILSLPPLCCLACMAIRTKLKLFCTSSIGGSIVIIFVIIFYLYLLKMEFNEKQMEFEAIHVLLLSVVYGVLAIHSCIIGMGIPSKSFSPEQSTVLKDISVFASIAVILCIFLLERVIIREKKLYLNAFLMSFIFLAIAVSFLYVMLGYNCKNGNHSYNPQVFLISAAISFSIATTISIFVLEYGRALQNEDYLRFAIGLGIALQNEDYLRITMSRWTFLCIWTIFMNSLSVFISRRSSGISKIIICVLNKLIDN